MITVAVQQTGEGFQIRWPEFLRKHGAEVKIVDVLGPDGLRQLKGCSGLMWHWAHYPDHKQSALPILQLVEQHLRLPVFPDLRTRWHFDDKIAQAFLFEALGIPHPKTWVFWRREDALAWADAAPYPVVAKLSCGAGSTNVTLARNPADARAWIDRLFSRRGTWPAESPVLGPRWKGMVRPLYDFAQRAASLPGYLFAGRAPVTPRVLWGLQKNHALFQEFLPDNPHDTRITVIGDRAFGFRRLNRPDDFRASGSGRNRTEPDEIDPRCVRLALESAAKIGAQSMAFDLLFRGASREPVVVEISYGYNSAFVERCPGHWDARLQWHEGRMWPEEAHAIDFLAHIRAHPC
jgi:hypothetical protein